MARFSHSMCRKTMSSAFQAHPKCVPRLVDKKGEALMFATPDVAPLRSSHEAPLRFVPIINRLWFVAMHALVFVLLLVASSAHAASRVKDVAGFEGMRENMLVGYGLVTGLQGTGDDLK